MGLVIAVVVLFALLLGGLPNSARLPVTSNMALLQILWQDSPWATIKLVLVDEPLVVIEQVQQATGLQVWGMFYFPGTLLVYLLASAFAASHWSDLVYSSARQRVLFTAGIATLLIGVTYLRRAACCTSNPAWVLDTFLLAKVYTPGPGTVDWMQVYEHLKPWLPILQTGTVLGGMAMLYRWRLNTKSSP